MLERTWEYVPERGSHRLLLAYGIGVAGILAVGDGLNVIWFPMYQLGLPDTVFANTVVTIGGVGAFAFAYKLVVSTLDEAPVSAARGSTAADYGDNDPVQILKERYARGELSDDEFERKLDRLEDSESVDFDTDDRQAVVRETGFDDGLVDRETAIE